MHRFIWITLITSVALLSPFHTAVADDDDDGKSNVACPVASPYGAKSFTDMFGDDVVAKMRCNKRRSEVKMVMQVNQFLDGKNRPYGFRNLPNIIKDLKITHGIKKSEIVVIVHSGGYPAVLDPAGDHPEAWKNAQAPGPFAAKYPTVADMVTAMMAQGVKIYFCLNTAAAKQIRTSQVLPGIEFVPAGLSSLIDYQYSGYKYVQP